VLPDFSAGRGIANAPSCFLFGGCTAFFSKGGRATTTSKLPSSKYYVEQAAAFALLWLKDLSIPDGKVKVKVTVVISGKTIVIEDELEIKGGKSTQGLKIAGFGEIPKVVSVEITY